MSVEKQITLSLKGPPASQLPKSLSVSARLLGQQHAGSDQKLIQAAQAADEWDQRELGQERRHPQSRKKPQRLGPARFNRHGAKRQNSTAERYHGELRKPESDSGNTELDGSQGTLDARGDQAGEVETLRNANSASATVGHRALQDPLFDEINEDPIAGALRCQAQVDMDQAGFRRCRLLRIAEAYLVAAKLKADFRLWREFLKLESFKTWGKLHALDEFGYVPEVTEVVMQFTFNPTFASKAKGNRAWKYARAVEAYEKEKVPAEELADRIEKDGGIEKLCRLAARDNPRTSAKPMAVALESEEETTDQVQEEPRFIKVAVSAQDALEYWSGLKKGASGRLAWEMVDKEPDGMPILVVTSRLD